MSKYIADTIGWFFPAATSKNHSNAAVEDFIAAKDDAIGLGSNVVTLGADLGHIAVKTGAGAIAASHSVAPLTVLNGALQTATYTVPHMVPAALAPTATVVTAGAFSTLSVALTAAVTNPLGLLGIGATVGLVYSSKSLTEGAVAISEMPGNVYGTVKNITTGTTKATISTLLAVKEYLDPDAQNGFATEGTALTSKTVNFDFNLDDFDSLFGNDEVTVNFANAELRIKEEEASQELFDFDKNEEVAQVVIGEDLRDGWELLS